MMWIVLIVRRVLKKKTLKKPEENRLPQNDQVDKVVKLFSLYILYVTLYFWLYLVFRTPDAIRFLTFQK